MIALGIVLLIIGFLAHVPIIWTLGVIAVVVGAVLAIVGGAGHAVGGRRHWY
ncbi:hypothetical protein SAMN05444157_0262 [Frankineae bacterium MT45]|nr:hypothetical protein SAMN05444157_0262 [Frankineae bacterium MT45]